MGLITRFRRMLKALAGEQVVVQPYFKSIGFAQFADEETAQDRLKHFVHWVYVCVTKNASAMASVPLRVYVSTDEEGQYKYLRKGKDTRAVKLKKLKELATNPLTFQRINRSAQTEEVVNHPFIELWRNVNPFMNGYEMVELIDIYLEMTGDAYLYIVKDNLGVPRQLWILPSQYVRVVPDRQNFIKGYLYGTSASDSVALTPDEVIHFKFPNPNSIWKGFPPLAAGMAAVKRKESMDDYEASLLANNARPDFLIVSKNAIPKTTKKELREEWQMLYGSKRGRGKPALIDSADIEIKELGFSPKDIAYVNGQKMTKEEIAGTFGVPVSKIVPDAKYSNAEVGDREWKSDTIRPRLRRIEDKLNEQLMPMYDKKLYVAFDNPVPEDREFALKKSETYLKNGVITINEVREAEGLEPVNYGESAWMPMNMIPVGSAIGGAGQQQEPEEITMSLKAKDDGEIHFPVKSDWFYSGVPVMAERMKRIFRKMEKAALDFLESQKAMRKAPASIEWNDFTLEKEKWAALINAEMGKPIREQLLRGAKHGARVIGVGISFDVLNPETISFLDRYVAHFADVVLETTAKDFAFQMQQGLQAGETIPELTTRTRSFFEGMKTWRAEQIARSESSRASHQGMVESWKQSEVVEAITWDAQADACPYCVELDGTTVAINGKFFEQGSSMTVEGAGTLNFNYEPVTAPPLHPNCRCTLRAELR